ncbi:MAG: acylneuraminate cytidylyltransferase family protein [Sphingorhabdus sp.]
MYDEDVQAFIFARGGSKGVPRKNIICLGGRPLISYSIECAQKCPSLGQVIVSTDDAEIAEVSQKWGARVPFLRPAELASDTASEWHAWQHAIKYCEDNEKKFGIFVSLPTTSPFRAIADVEACIALLRKHPETDAVITVKKAERSPYFNMVTIGPDGHAGIVMPPIGEIARRQDAPEVFDMTTVAYAVRTKFIKEQRSLFAGRLRVVEVPSIRAIDIDTPYDFMLAELMVNNSVVEIGQLSKEKF